MRAAWALARVPLNGQERDAAAGMLLETLERDNDETLWERFLCGLLWGYGSRQELADADALAVNPRSLERILQRPIPSRPTASGTA